MDSPSIQPVESTLFDPDGAPSSPFLSEVDTKSRSASKQYQDVNVDGDMVILENNVPSALNAPIDYLEDKENMTDQDPTLAKLFKVPPRSTTPELKLHPNDRTASAGSLDSNLMPPPSMKKLATTPKRSPLMPSRLGPRTPKSARRDEVAASVHTDATTPPTPRGNTPSVLEHHTSIDDTCFSTFSEAPDMTAYARQAHSPFKEMNDTHRLRQDYRPTPLSSRKRPSPSRSPSPTPRSRRVGASTFSGASDNTTSFLIDFTQQMENVNSYRHNASVKSSTESNLLQYINSQRSPNKTSRQSYATPSKQSTLLNLLDFELPPAPTPRSVPTITVRELESLKSSYLSQISNLKATLNGREAEVEALKKAVGDAERRAGEAHEALREEKSKREQIEEEKQGWERRGLEVEQVLRNVKEEVIKGEAEKEEMVCRIEDAERRMHEAETRATKAEERLASTLASTTIDGGNSADAEAIEARVQQLVLAQIDAKIEAVSRELHAVYKEKHERKVATLKKSYEARAEKKLAELQSRLSALELENQDLQNAKNESLWSPAKDISSLNSETVHLKAQLEEQKAHMLRLQSQMEASNAHQEQLERELRQERIEKGDLVAAVDEMLALQAENQSAPDATSVQGAVDMVQDFRKSITRPRSLQPPGPSKIGKSAMPTPSLGRSLSGTGGKSRMLANIERMGRTGAKDGVSGLQ